MQSWVLGLCGALFLGSMPSVRSEPLRDLMPADASNWKEIQDAQLTPDGQWLIYRLVPAGLDGLVTVVLRNTHNDTEQRYVAGIRRAGGGEALQLSPSGRWIAFMMANERSYGKSANYSEKSPSHLSATIVEVASGRKLEFPDVRRVVFSGRQKRSEWVALHGYTEQSEGNPKIGKAADSGVSQAADLVLKALPDGQSERIFRVNEFAFNTTGTRLAWADANGLQLRALASGKTRVLDSTVGSSYRALTWSERDQGLATIRIDEGAAAQRTLLVFTHVETSSPKTYTFSPSDWRGFPDGYEISAEATRSFRLKYGAREALTWRENDDGVFFGIRPVNQAVPARLVGGRLSLWHWKDSLLPGNKESYGSEDTTFSYLSLVSLKNGQFVRLADPTLPYVDPQRYGSHVLGHDSSAYERLNATTGKIYRDYFIVDLNTGQRTLIAKHLRVPTFPRFGPPPMLSPDGQHVLYRNFDDGGHYIVYDIITGMRRNLTERLPTHFLNPLDLSSRKDFPTSRLPILIQGWVSGGAYVLVSDGCDTWALPLKSGRAVNLTGGEHPSKIVYSSRLGDLDKQRTFDETEPEKYFSEPLIAEKKPLYFRAVDVNTGRTLLARRERGLKGRFEILHAEDADVRYYKAKDADVYVATRQTAVDSLDFYRVDNLWRLTQRLTHANPQQREFHWSGGARVIEYSTDAGVKLREVLHFPAGYAPGKSYPTIVSVYEEQDGQLHEYQSPQTDVSRWTKHGYAVLMASVRSRQREPGTAATEGVIAGIDAAVRTGVVDAEHLGLTGVSFGGYQTNLVLTNTSIFKAAISISGISNLLADCTAVYNDLTPKTRTCTVSQPYMGALWWVQWGPYVENSPLFQASQIKTPLLLVHGDADRVISSSESLGLFNTLRAIKEDPVMFLQYKGVGHIWRHDDAATRDAEERMLQFFDHYLRGAPAPTWWSEGLTWY